MMTTQSPVVSILVPVYGVERYVEECVRSLMEQSYKECRYIFVDDCTPDKSIEIIRQVAKEYPHRKGQINIITHPENRGIGATRNTLIDNAQGEFVVWVDSDDWVESHFVESLVVRAVATRADAVRCGRVEFDSNGVGRDERFTWLASPRQTCRAIVGQSHLVTCNIHGVMVRRDLIESHNIRVAEGINMAEDYLLTSQILFHAQRIANLDEPLYFYRTLREGSYMESMATTQHAGSYVRANVWVTQYIETQAGGERYHRDLATAKVNIKKWITKRGLPPKIYDNELFGARRDEWLRPLHLRIYNWVVNLNVILLTQLAAAVVSLPLIARVAWHRFMSQRAKNGLKIWGA